jgi:hypothetical protein
MPTVESRAPSRSGRSPRGFLDDQLTGAAREPGHQRTDAEQGQAHDQQLLATVPVGGAARGVQSLYTA